MPPFVAALFGFIRGIPGAALNFIDRRRWWAKEDRAEIEKTYRDEIDVLQEQLNDATTDEEKRRIGAEIQRVRDELRSFHRARRELLLSKSLVQRMTPAGAITAGEPALPQADREILEAAATVVARLEPPKTFEEHFRQGNAFYAAAQFDKALERYNRALELRPDDPMTINNRGATLGSLKRYDHALADYNRSLELRPDDPDTLYNRGHTLDDLQRYDESLVDYNRSLELRPDDPNTLNNRGVTLDNMMRYEEALADYNRALELRPGDPVTLNNRGVTLTNLQRYDEALADYNRALQLRPDHPSTLYNRACAYSRMGRFKESLDDLRRSIDLDENSRVLAREDEDHDFDNLRSDPTLGPKFEGLVAEPEAGSSPEPESR